MSLYKLATKRLLCALQLDMHGDTFTGTIFQIYTAEHIYFIHTFNISTFLFKKISVKFCL